MTTIRPVTVLTARDLQHPPIAAPGEHIRIDLTAYDPHGEPVDWSRLARYLQQAEHIEVAAPGWLLARQVAERLRF